MNTQSGLTRRSLLKSILQVSKVVAAVAVPGCLLEYLTIPLPRQAEARQEQLQTGRLEETVVDMQTEAIPPTEQITSNSKFTTRFELVIEQYAPNPKNFRRVEQSYFTFPEVQEVGRIAFAEMANSSNKIDEINLNAEILAQIITNRIYTHNYPDTVWENIHNRRAFSCTFDGSIQWQKATFRAHANAYEKAVLERMIRIADNVMQKKQKPKVSFWRDVIAYHDDSIPTPNDAYWNKLKPIAKVGHIYYFVPREKGDTRKTMSVPVFVSSK